MRNRTFDFRMASYPDDAPAERLHQDNSRTLTPWTPITTHDPTPTGVPVGQNEQYIPQHLHESSRSNSNYEQHFEVIPMDSYPRHSGGLDEREEPLSSQHRDSHNRSITSGRASSKRRRRNLEMWWLEILSCFVMISALLAIVATLLSYQAV